MIKRRYVPNLISDMAECDANYMRLLKLFPDMRSEEIREFGLRGHTEDGSVVTIRILERCPYTTMLKVQVESDENKPWIRWPTIEIRMYHDVRTAEVTQFERVRNIRYRYEVPNDGMHQPDEKAQINRFLGELLTFCISHGHSLERVAF
tara:strand:- start:1004 stop:1450 length:447 start_codon:yes stop_codon:yes gene_type:complete